MKPPEKPSESEDTVNYSTVNYRKRQQQLIYHHILKNETSQAKRLRGDIMESLIAKYGAVDVACLLYEIEQCGGLELAKQAFRDAHK